ncbi:BTB/POZ domain-containing protein 6-B-like [Porites lutea]|uniref:BTB/POZ domain-containing protein 6-B-like n=1 Tax=Porites lutea TaxID=51062 RepID=UPI003CC54E2B
MASPKSQDRWQTKAASVLERSKHMFKNPLLSDIKFAFPSVNSEATILAIPAHKYVLAVSSPVFFTMFYGDLAESGDSVNITDCDPDVFLRFLRFIYCDEASFEDIDSAIKVWRLADMYDLPSLARECVKYLDGNMEPLDAFDVLTYARQFNDEEMEKACWEVIDYNAEVIVADESFLDVKQELLLLFVERSSARIQETTLFQALDGWAAKRCEEAGMTVNGENKRGFMGEDLLKQFRFSLMSPSDFSDVVMPTEILFLTEVIDVFKQFTSVSIPGGFKFSLSPRKAADEPLFSFNTGEVQVPDQETMASGATSDVSNKTGLFTFAVKKDITLRGVVIVTDKDQESYQVSLSITQRGKKIKQIKSKTFMRKETLDSDSHGEAVVVFNRPMNLLKNTCFTIETETATTNNRNSAFVRQNEPAFGSVSASSTVGGFNFGAGKSSFGISSTAVFSTPTPGFNFTSVPTSGAKAINSSPSEKSDKYDVVSCCSFGKCHSKCPDHSKYSGEIIQLLFKE